MAAELTKRIAVAAVGVPLGFFVVYKGGIWLGVFLAFIAAGAAWELYRMAAQKGTQPFNIFGCVLAATFVLMATAVPTPMNVAPRFMLVIMVSLLLLSALAIWLRGVAGNPLNVVAVTLFGALLTGGTLSYAIFLRAIGWPYINGLTIPPHPPAPWASPSLLLFALGLTWLSDTFAYFGGRMWGNRKLIPSVSPGKTVAGAVSGVIGTTIIGGVYASFVFGQWLHIPITPLQGAIGGALISVVAQVGDLSESLLKREAGVKDSGTLLPGHGGMFDRFDSLLFVFPTAYWYISYLLRLQ